MDDSIWAFVMALISGGVVSAIVTWLGTRKKTAAEASESISNAAKILVDPLTERLEALQKEVDELTVKISSLETAGKEKDTQIYHLGQKLKDKDDQVRKLEERVRELECEIQILKAENAQLRGDGDGSKET